jgi:hypothetical protein
MAARKWPATSSDSWARRSGSRVAPSARADLTGVVFVTPRP